jgi:hypothetical protein
MRAQAVSGREGERAGGGWAGLSWAGEKERKGKGRGAGLGRFPFFFFLFLFFSIPFLIQT